MNAQLNTIRAHRTSEQRKEQKNDWANERILCKICGKTYIRNNKTQHNRSKRHRFCVKFNQSKKITNEKFKKLKTLKGL